MVKENILLNNLYEEYELVINIKKHLKRSEEIKDLPKPI